MGINPNNLKSVNKSFHSNSDLIKDIVDKKNSESIVKNDSSPNLVTESKKSKIFVIGHNKTATTSVIKNIADFGFKVGHQMTGELMLYEYLNNNFNPIIEHCKTADAFKDVPFSLHNTYKHLDIAFPNSKFILTIRDNEDEWYDSIVRFHTKIFKGKLPDAKSLKESKYIKIGWQYLVHAKTYNVEDNDLYNKEKLVMYYKKHNEDVENYFKDRPNDLLILNVKEINGYKKFCVFLGVEKKGKFYHLMRSK
jgi:hypothetical protein